MANEDCKNVFKAPYLVEFLDEAKQLWVKPRKNPLRPDMCKLILYLRHN